MHRNSNIWGSVYMTTFSSEKVDCKVLIFLFWLLYYWKCDFFKMLCSLKKTLLFLNLQYCTVVGNSFQNTVWIQAPCAVHSCECNSTFNSTSLVKCTRSFIYTATLCTHECLYYKNKAPRVRGTFTEVQNVNQTTVTKPQSEKHEQSHSIWFNFDVPRNEAPDSLNAHFLLLTHL